jgi:hypothetical protein
MMGNAARSDQREITYVIYVVSRARCWVPFVNMTLD